MRQQIVLQIVSIILIVFMKQLVFKDTLKRTVGETAALVFISLVVWIVANRVRSSYNCGAVISKSCEGILADAHRNKCTSADLPHVVVL